MYVMFCSVVVVTQQPLWSVFYRYMRPYVTSEPDFKQLPVTEEDEFIVGGCRVVSCAVIDDA